MSKFAAALDELTSETPDETPDVAEVETADETPDADASAEGDETPDEADEPAEKVADAKDEKDEEEPEGSWFAPKKDAAKPDADKPVGKKQDKMPETVRQRIERETRAKVDAERPWAQGWTNEEGAAVRELWDLGRTNIVALVDRVIRSAHGNPVTRGQLEGYLASIGLVPKGAGQQPAQDEDPMPQLAADAEGKVTIDALNSHNKAMLEWNKRQNAKEVERQLAPLVGDRDRQQKQQQETAASEAYANRMNDILQQPEFQDAASKADIKKIFNAKPRPWVNAQGYGNANHPQYKEERELLLEALYEVRMKNVAAQKKRELAQDLQKKKDVNAVNPQGGSGAVKGKKPKGFLEALKQESSRGSAR